MLRTPRATRLLMTVSLLVSPLLMTACSMEINDSKDEDVAEDTTKHPTTPSTPDPIVKPVDPCAGNPDDPDVLYSVTRNSRLDQRSYDVGGRITGTVYVSAYQVGKGPCAPDGLGTRDLYEQDVKAIWIEISQMTPYDPSFIKTYYVPEESISFHDSSEDMGLLIDPRFIVLDDAFVAGHDYLIRVKLENSNGVVTSAKAWNNDMEAFHSIGFSMNPPATPADGADRTDDGDGTGTH